MYGLCLARNSNITIDKGELALKPTSTDIIDSQRRYTPIALYLSSVSIARREIPTRLYDRDWRAWEEREARKAKTENGWSGLKAISHRRHMTWSQSIQIVWLARPILPREYYAMMLGNR